MFKYKFTQFFQSTARATGTPKKKFSRVPKTLSAGIQMPSHAQRKAELAGV
jgi:hypothetical protein